MSSVKFARRLAARILGVGETRIWIDPDHLDRVSTAISRDDVRKYIHEGVIRKRPPSTPSRGRVRERRVRKKKGRRRGPGRRKGPRVDEKELWVTRIRVQRRYLKALRDRGVISRREYRLLYRLAKGGMFRSLSHMKLFMRSKGIGQK